VTPSDAEGLQQVPYCIVYSPAAEEHLGRLTARQRATVFNAIDEQLSHQAAVETRNRKPLRANPIAPWELRVGALRVYYDVTEEPEPTVAIHAVGVKRRNQVYIGGKAIDL
jgi:mRNA-degrading endonuclease RelE of RelBE toxin-antitoxin system